MKIINKIKLFILKRLIEGPTWAAIITLLSDFGFDLTTEQSTALAAFMIIILPNNFNNLNENNDK
jgi:hypothetical protein